jgi:type IV secretion system protein VirB1
VPLGPAMAIALATRCAPNVAPETMMSVVRVESGFDPLAIGTNGPKPARLHPKNLAAAIDIATRLIVSGGNVDLGLGQINSANLAPLGLSVADAFEPCRNLRAAGAILQQAYRSQSPEPNREQIALRAALSIYNTGRADRGFYNGYVAKVSAAAGVPMPPQQPIRSDPPTDAPPAWDVFAQSGASARFVFTSTERGHP